jgi:hypothetical protein
MDNSFLPRGVWPALPIAWNDREEFDSVRYESDITYLCSRGIHGIYSGGTTGEFYTLDFDEFAVTNAVMLKTNMKCGLRCRKPYKFFSQNELNEIRDWIEHNDPDLLDVN